MMFSLGNYIFSTKTAAFQNKKGSKNYRWQEQEVIGQEPVYQYLGPGTQTITLDGVLYADLVDGEDQVAKMHASADAGEALTLVDGSGNVYGKWAITNIEEMHSVFQANGTPRKIAYSLQLKKVDERPIESRGDVANINVV